MTRPLRSPTATGALLALALFAVGCGGSATPSQDDAADGAGTETFAPGQTGEVRQITTVLPGQSEPSTVTVEVFGGIAVYQGDIILGEIDPELGAQAIVVSGDLWEGNTVPFRISNEHNGTMRQRIRDAIDHFEANTGLRFVERNGQGSWVEFARVDEGCSSRVGRQGGKQEIKLSNDCGFGAVVHEIGHAVGLWHEQSRQDRNSFVTVLWDNIIDGKEHNFEQHVHDGADYGTYDYGSIMHYSSTAFGKVDLFGNRLTTLETTAEIGNRDGLSPKDIAAIDALYPPGAMVDLYEGNGATQNVVCSLVVGDEGFVSYDFPELDECDNDEARSMVLRDVPAGRVIRLYDSPSGSTDDDWVRIRVLQPVTDYVIPTFENSFEDASVHVTYHPHNGLDGKVSRLVTSGNAFPSVTIVQPTGEAPLPNGGINLIDFEARANDPEDGLDCCTVVWTSDVDGVLGVGRSIQYAFTSPGTRVVTATATDSDGGSGSASVTLEVVNAAPVPLITAPTPGEAVPVGIPYTLQGSASDLGDLGGIPCGQLTWSSSVAGDPSPTGCNPQVVFETTGIRELTLTAVDDFGASGSTSVVFAVVAAPELWAAITEPKPDALFLEGTPVDLAGVISQEFDLPATFTWNLFPDGRSSEPVAIADGDVMFFTVTGSKLVPDLAWNPVDDAIGTGEHDLQLVIDGANGSAASARVRIAISKLE